MKNQDVTIKNLIFLWNQLENKEQYFCYQSRMNYTSAKD